MILLTTQKQSKYEKQDRNLLDFFNLHEGNLKSATQFCNVVHKHRINHVKLIKIYLFKDALLKRSNIALVGKLDPLQNYLGKTKLSAGIPWTLSVVRRYLCHE